MQTKSTHLLYMKCTYWTQDLRKNQHLIVNFFFIVLSLSLLYKFFEHDAGAGSCWSWCYRSGRSSFPPRRQQSRLYDKFDDFLACSLYILKKYKMPYTHKPL